MKMLTKNLFTIFIDHALTWFPTSKDRINQSILPLAAFHSQSKEIPPKMATLLNLRENWQEKRSYWDSVSNLKKIRPAGFVILEMIAHLRRGDTSH